MNSYRKKNQKKLILFSILALIFPLSSCVIEIIPEHKTIEQKERTKTSQKKLSLPDDEYKDYKTEESFQTESREEELVIEMIEEDIIVEELETLDETTIILSEEEAFSYFKKGEELFKKVQLELSKKNFKNFLKSEIKNNFTDDAYYRIGQIYFYLRNYDLSLKYFKVLLDEFEDSDLRKDAEYYSGLCYFFTHDFKLAVNAFEKQIPFISDSKRLSKIHYFNAKSNIKLKNHLKAVSEFMKVIDDLDNKNIKQHAKNDLIDLINHKMGKRDLEEVRITYEENFPADYALYKLVYHSSLENNYEFTKIFLEQIISNFPEFKYIEEVQSWKKSINAIIMSNEIKIGAILPLSGRGANAGLNVLRGIKLAFNSIATGYEGYELRLLVKDSNGDPNTALKLANELSLIDNVSVIIGPVFSNSAKKIVPVSKKFRIPIITPTASSANLTKKSDYIFRNCMTNSLQGKKISEYAVNKLNLKRFVTLYPENNYGSKLKDIFKENIEKLGGQIVFEKSYNPKSFDFSKEIKSIGGINDDEFRKILKNNPSRISLNRKFSSLIIEDGIDTALNTEYIKPALKINYDAIFIPGFFKKVGLIAPELSFYNISGVKLLGTNGWNSPDLIKIGGKYVENSIFIDGFFKGSKRKIIVDFVKKYKEIYHDEPDILAAQAYDATNIIGMALKTGLISREGIKKYMSESVKDYNGISGKTSITETGDSDKELFLLEVKKGTIVEINQGKTKVK